MADEKRDSQVKTSEQLDEELDGFLETIKEKNKNFKYTDGFTSENIDEVNKIYNKAEGYFYILHDMAAKNTFTFFSTVIRGDFGLFSAVFSN